MVVVHDPSSSYTHLPLFANERIAREKHFELSTPVTYLRLNLFLKESNNVDKIIVAEVFPLLQKTHVLKITINQLNAVYMYFTYTQIAHW